MVGEARLSRAVRRLRRLAAVLGLVAIPAVAAETFVVEGACRDGEPNGAYLLRSADGRLRVAGAFAKGRRTGTFLFWNDRGSRIAVVPYDNDRKVGTVALWYPPASPSADLGRKSESTYVDDRLHGEKRSWYPKGNPRTELRYERGVLVAASAWVEAGARVPDDEAREWAARDLVTDEQFYATLEVEVAGHRPRCE